MKLVFASNNHHKLEEINNLLGNGFELLSLSDIGCLEELPETRATLEDNASQKALYLYQNYGYDCFADDTGLEIEALNWEPGVFSARYAGPEKDSNANVELVLQKLHKIKNRKARFRTVISLIIGGKEYLFEGMVDGTILQERRGERGFGYDPVFQPEGSSKSFAEMDLDVKNQISHRARAVAKLAEFLRNLPEPCMGRTE